MHSMIGFLFPQLSFFPAEVLDLTHHSHKIVLTVLGIKQTGYPLQIVRFLYPYSHFYSHFRTLKNSQVEQTLDLIGEG
jgi:hypothetical protein